MRARLLLLVALVLVPATPAGAYVPERTPHREAEASVRAALDEPEARGTLPAILVVRGGRTLFALNADRAMQPASVIKLLTTAAALERFGPAHRFHTRVLARARAATVPSLYLVGGGDPTLATERYRKMRFEPKPSDEIQRPAFASGSPTIEQLASRVAAAGIRVVSGDLVADESLFDTVRTQAGWPGRYLAGDAESGLLSALTVDEGRAGPKGPNLASPAAAAGEALRAALRARGVRVNGALRVGRAPAGNVEVARVSSPPLSEIVDFINRYSINYHIELLLKALGAAHGDAGTTAAGVAVVKATLTQLGVRADELLMADASGLSIDDRVSARTVAALLDRVLTATGPAWEAMRESIPAAAGPGTLVRRMRGTPAAGNLRGKTGSIRGVRAMAGWVVGRDGVPLIYVAMFNGSALTAKAKPLDLLGSLLAGYPRT